jgi:RhtB (resistance to homoserine/threonine) family protein
MEIFAKWMLVALVQTAATMSPGPAFALTVRNAMVYDRQSGIYTAVGLGLGIAVHIALVLGGISVVISKSVFLFNLIKYAGAAYLIYIGIKALVLATKKPAGNESSTLSGAARQSMSVAAALRAGFLTNLLNPKAVVFFTAVYSQFISIDTAWHILLLYGATSILIEITWFSFVVLFLTHARIRTTFLKFSVWIERICGGLLLLLGLRIALTKAVS